MSVNPVNANTQVYSEAPAANPQSTASSNKNHSSIPEDTVTLSSTAKAKHGSSSADVDHDGDSK